MSETDDGAPAQTQRRGFVVSHSHWDRAWYLPFESFRHRLVRMVDRLMDLLDADDRFHSFALDGQTVLLEDYLEIRPEREADLRRLIAAGRLSVGPWYVSPDLFLVTGEALIRNLQRGLRMAEDFGGSMPIGYVPDPFGHPAHMPQVLRSVGIDSYVFMRGMDAETRERCGGVFDWVAPDGSSVLAIYQRDGYFNAGALGQPSIFGRFDGRAPTIEEAEAQIRAAIDTLEPLQPVGPLLFSNGMDHMPEQPELPDLIRELSSRIDGIELVHSTYPAFVSALKDAVPVRPSYAGDLLGNADHPILQSVGSTRIYLKQQNHAAQSLLLGTAEPLAALAHLTPGAADARPFLQHAWRELIRNHPHDDICGCSADAVHRDDETRFRHVMEIGDAVAVEVLEGLVRQGVAPPAETGAFATDVFVWNPHPWPQRARVRTTILFPREGGEFGPPVPEQTVRAVDGEGRDVPVVVSDTREDVMRSAFLEQTWGRRYEVAFEVDLPPMGYSIVHLFGADEVQPSVAPTATLENDAYRLSADADGLVLHCKELGLTFDNVLRFEYQSDGGDTYSFSPVPSRPVRWARFVGAAPHESDPHILRATFELRVPASLADDSEVAMTLHVEAELDPSGAVAFRVAYRNEARNGRLRAVMPTGLSSDVAVAGALFGYAERRRPEAVQPEDVPERYAAYPGELVYDTQHHEDFVAVEGDTHTAWVADRGLPEYALLDEQDGASIALTLHRAVGFLSVRNGRIRRCGAGPEVPTPEAQCVRDMHAEFALGAAAISRDQMARRARAFSHPAWTREMPYLPYAAPVGAVPRTASLLSIGSDAVRLLSFRPEDDSSGCCVRLLNTSPSAVKTTISTSLGFDSFCLTDSRERWDEPRFQTLRDGSLEVSIPPHGLRTLLLRKR